MKPETRRAGNEKAANAATSRETTIATIGEERNAPGTPDEDRHE